MLGGKGHDGVHVSHLTEKMDGNNGFGFIRDESGGVNGVEVEADGTDVTKNRGGSDSGDAASRGEKSESGNKDLISGADAEGHEGEEDRIGAGGDAQVVGDAGVRGAFLLKSRDIRSHDELAAQEDSLEGGLEFITQRIVLGVDV